MFFNKQHTRIRYIFLFVIIILILVIIKVFYTEVISYNKLKDLSDNLYSRRLPIMADRGKIVDRNGKVLATNITTTSLVLIPRQITDKEKVAKRYMAKGLEFDSVIIYTDKDNKYTNDEKYLYYVAITRAQHKLIVYNQ